MKIEPSQSRTQTALAVLERVERTHQKRTRSLVIATGLSSVGYLVATAAFFLGAFELGWNAWSFVAALFALGIVATLSGFFVVDSFAKDLRTQINQLGGSGS